MKKYLIAATALALAVSPALALAAEKPAPDAAATVELPADIKVYVTTHPAPLIPYSGKVSIGHGVDGDQIWQSLPAYPDYHWTNLNGQLVVVDKRSRRVIAIY